MRNANRLMVLLTLMLPVVASAGTLFGDMNHWVENQLSGNEVSLSAYLFLVLGGLLASLLPCVYPLYPITASVIKARASGERSALHPITYYGGLVTVYCGFGLVAAATGGAFNEVLRLPLTNLLLAAVFLVLALATAGLIHISAFSGDALSGKTPGLPGTFAMGMGAGLLSSSCVGPFVISILLGLASQTAQASAATLLVAASKMLAFGMGVGLPLLLVALFGVRLPRSGRWMGHVQKGLGALILYCAFVYLDKGLAGYGVEPERIQHLFIGGLVLMLAVYRWDAENLPSHHRSERAVLALMGVVGVLILFQSAGISTPVPMASAATPVSSAVEPQTERKGELVWYLNRADAVKAAREQGKPIFIDFFAHWCANCKAFEALTANSPALVEGMKQAVLLKIYDTDPEFQQFKQDSRFPELKIGLPFFVVMDGEEQLLYKTSDYTRTDEMLMFLGG